MIRSLKVILFFLSLVLVVCCNKDKDVIVSFTNPEIAYMGRIDSNSHKGAELYWSGSSVKLNFEGSAIRAMLKDETGDNYYTIILDNDSSYILRPDTLKKQYTLASGLPEGKHSIELFKRTEWNRGKTTFYGFQLSGRANIVPKDPPKQRKIEFYGNSITAGYAVEDLSGKDSPDSTYTNNYRSYAAITARHYNAAYSCICKSGIGITIGWSYPEVPTMPEIYDRLNPVDPTSLWNFSNYTPGIVVVNLFQNDSWLVKMPETKEFKARFGKEAPEADFIVTTYENFIASLRKRYPETTIICALGSMSATREGSEWMDYILQAVQNLEDEKIITHFFPFKNTGGHPSIKEQETMAESLIQFIDENVEW